MNNKHTLSILRNPYGFSEDEVRCVRNYAADLIEDMERKLQAAQLTLWAVVKAAGSEVTVPYFLLHEVDGAVLERKDLPGGVGTVYRAKSKPAEPGDSCEAKED